MDPHLLRTFVTVAECGSFSAAAGRLGYTQSAVSQQIAALEADLATMLLQRRPVAVTEAGARLLEHAAPILLRLEAARADVMRAGAPPATSLTIGVTPLAAAARLAVALARLRQLQPRLAVTVRVAGRADIPAQVATGELDLGLVDGVTAPGDPLRLPGPAAATGIGEAELAVVLPAGHPLAGRPALRLADLADARWLDAPDAGPPLADLRAATGSDGFVPALRFDGLNVATLVSLAAAQHGLTLLPRPLLAGVPGIAAVPLAWPPLVHRTELVSTAAGGAAGALVSLLQAGQGAGRRY